MTTPGDPSDPRHSDWLIALGAATDTAASLATICFDLARVLGGVTSSAMYKDPLGALEKRVGKVAVGFGTAPPPDLAAFVAALPSARETRNDLLHALRLRDVVVVPRMGRIGSRRAASHPRTSRATVGARGPADGHP